jgi:hypothetical protein
LEVNPVPQILGPVPGRADLLVLRAPRSSPTSSSTPSGTAKADAFREWYWEMNILDFDDLQFRFIVLGKMSRGRWAGD